MVVTLPILLLLVVLLGCSASISATEAAVLAINKVRLRHRMEQGDRTARLIYGLLTQLDHVIGTLLVANNLVNVAISAIGSWIFISLFGPQKGLVMSMLVITTLLLLIGEVTPKLVGVTHAEAVAFLMARPLRLLTILCYPVSMFFTGAARWLLRLLRIPTKRRAPLVTEEELKVMIQMGREEGVLAEQELRLLHRIFEFSDATVRQVMVPREQIVGIDLQATPEDVLDVLIEEGHSRIPVYHGSLDRVVGVLYARDLVAMVRHGRLFVLSDLIRSIKMVGPEKRIGELLTEFQQSKHQIAIVRGGGSTLGLVTIEDLLEEIVGEIHEEIPPHRPSG